MTFGAGNPQSCVLLGISHGNHRTPACSQPVSLHQVIARHAGGVAGLRIWRMLYMQGQLEEGTIVEAALMPPKEARTMLYTLLASGFVTMQV